MIGYTDCIVWKSKIDRVEGLRHGDRVHALDQLLDAPVCRRASTSKERPPGCSSGSNNSPAATTAAAAQHAGRHEGGRTRAAQKFEEASEAYPSEVVRRTISVVISKTS